MKTKTKIQLRTELSIEFKKHTIKKKVFKNRPTLHQNIENIFVIIIWCGLNTFSFLQFHFH